MATLNDITNFDSLKGDVATGGGDAGALNINTNDPLKTLSLYTNFYNQTVYNQTVQDRDAKIKNIAEVAKIDANNLFGKDKDFIVEKLNKLKDIATDYAKNPNLTIDDQLKWQTALSDVNNDYLSGKQRAVTYQSRLDTINTSFSGEAKDSKIKELNDEFGNTDIATQLSTGTGYKPVAVNLPTPVTVETPVIDAAGNFISDKTVTGFAWGANLANSNAASVGLGSLTKGLKGTELELQQQMEGTAQHFGQMTGVFNSAVGAQNADGSYKYFNKSADGTYTFQPNKFVSDYASNAVIMEAYNAVQGTTADAQRTLQAIQNGQYNSTGVPGKSFNNIVTNDVKGGIINITPQGLQQQQLILAGIHSIYDGNKLTQKVTKTGLAIDQQQVEVAKMNAKTNQGELGLAWKKFDFDKDKWAASQTGTEDMKSSALAKAQRIYGELEKLADKNGVITPDKLRQLNVEQLKYLGTEHTEKNNAGGFTTSFAPLGFAIDDKGTKGNFAIQLENGKINVLSNANPKTDSKGEIIKNPDGTITYHGGWDNVRSTNITNTATNILNEQLKNAGSKELNSYAPIDFATNDGSANGQIADPTISTTTTTKVSGGSSSKSSVSVPAGSITDFKAAGWTDSQIKIASKAGKIKIN